jgi:ubiquinone/menaquinone biosynthesis C-methylase UbiE
MQALNVGGTPLRSDELAARSLQLHLESPESTDVWDAPRRVRLWGWVVSPRGLPTRVLVDVGAVDRHEVTVDVERPDVPEALGLSADVTGTAVGFECDVDLPDDDLVDVVVRATDGDVVVTSDTFRFHRGAAPRVPEWRLPSAAPRAGSEATRSRAEYQQVWDDVAEQEDNAKIAVAGYTDESQFERTATETVNTLRQTVGVGSDDVILEIGAGVGRVGVALAPVCKKWIAADVSANMLEHAKERLRDHENVETVVLNGWDLSPIPSESLDVVYSTVVFMHLDEWDRFAYVCEAMRVLRPGGRVYIDNYTITGDEGWRFFADHFENIHPLDRPANISKSSTPAELEAYLRRAGFVDVRQASADMFVWAWARKPGP